MVSNVLEIEQEELIRKLKTFKKKYAGDAEWKKLRAVLPKGWPI